MSGVRPATLAGHEFLRGLAARHVALLAGAAELVSVPPGHRFFEEDGPTDRFWLIRTGHLALDLHVPGPERLIVETIGSGEALGLSWQSPPWRWQLGAEAIQPTTAFELDAARVRELCDADPVLGYQVSRRFMTVAAGRLHATRIRLLDLYAGSQDAARRP